MPFAVMVLGVAGAFTTMSMGKAKTSMPVQGYYFLSDQDRCHEGIECSDVDGDICKWGSITQVGKESEESTDCVVKLFKPN